MKLTSEKKFLMVMIALVVTLLIDTSLVKINDLIGKNFITSASKSIIFCVNSSISLLLQFIIIKQVTDSIGRQELRKVPKVKVIYIISISSFMVLAVFFGLAMFQILSYEYYETWINIIIVSITYGASALITIRLTLFFFQWYRSNHHLIILLYFASMSMIAFNLILTATFVDFKLTNVQPRVKEYIGGGGDASGAKYRFLANIYATSSILSFFSIWLTTAILMKSYREKLIRSVTYWVILLLPLVYFLTTYFYQFFLTNILSSIFQNDPVTVAIILSAFLSLSKPIGGIIFAIAFWNMSRAISYERKMKISMIIAGWGIFFIFSANQATSQIIAHYPPFGISTITIMITAAFLVVLGIHNSATLVSTNNSLRRHIHQRALKLLNPIGRAEMEREIQKTVKKISENRENIIFTEENFDFDENELKKYLNEVIKAKRENLS